MSLRPWFQEASAKLDADELARLSRQEAFDRGFLSVEDLDDEELRAGRCRDETGNIPRVAGKTNTIPRDQYDEMVAEHEKRFNQRLRERLDTMIDVICNVATDDTVEPRDRLEAAKYIFERVAGKTPERVQVNVSKAPWEDMLGGIAKITREQSHALRQGVIDAEVVTQDIHADDADGMGSLDAEVVVDVPVPNPESQQPKQVVPDEVFEHRYAPVPPVEDHNAPGNSASTMPTQPPPGWQPGDTWQDIAAKQKDLAQRRKEARERIKNAKKRRIIKRTTGADAWQGHEIVATEVEQPDGTVNVVFDAT
jgi:hypothetical protein